jgi:hypothetical protein
VYLGRLLFLFSRLALVVPSSFAQCPEKPYDGHIPTRVFQPILPQSATTASLVNPIGRNPLPPVLKIVAMGDSVVWGNGLTNQEKFIELTGQSLANQTQRTVQIVSFAHSGAKLSDTSGGFVDIISSDNNSHHESTNRLRLARSRRCRSRGD